MELEQRFLLRKQKCRILEDGVELINGNSNESENYSFDNIERKWFIRTYRNPQLLVASVAMLIVMGFIALFATLGVLHSMPVVYEVAALLTLLSVVLYFAVPMREYCIITDDQRVVPLFKDKPNSEKFDTFVEEIFKARNKYIRDNYFFIDEKAPYEEEMWKLKWLNKELIISDAEFMMAAQQIKR